MRSECGIELCLLAVLMSVRRLNRLLGDVVISQGGVVPHIAAVRPCPLSSIYRLIVRFQELLPSKSRCAILLVCVTSANAYLCYQQRKEGSGRGLIFIVFLLFIGSIIHSMYFLRRCCVSIRLFGDSCALGLSDRGINAMSILDD